MRFIPFLICRVKLTIGLPTSGIAEKKLTNLFLDLKYPLLTRSRLKTLLIEPTFGDIAQLSTDFRNAIRGAAEAGIALGMGDGNFCPNATCTRAQIITFLYRSMAD